MREQAVQKVHVHQGVSCSCLFALYGHLPVTKKLRISIGWLTPFFVSFAQNKRNNETFFTIHYLFFCIDDRLFR